METGLTLKLGARMVGAESSARVRILVCSQMPASLKNMARLLLEAGFDVVACQGFSELMDTAEDVQPRLIIVEENDWPWGRGFDLVTLRKICRASVIALGDSSETETMARALNAGADYYMVRPYGKAELLARIKALLRR